MTARQPCARDGVMVRLALLLAVPVGLAHTQETRPPQPAHTLSLGALHASALAHDPRSTLLALMREASSLRERDLATAKQLQSVINGQATYQSDVTALPLAIPGTTIAQPPLERFQVTLDLEQPIYDAGAVASRQAVERARLEESTSEVRAQLHRVKQEVNAALFTALLMQEQTAALDVALTALQQRLQETRSRVADGAALGRDTSALLAEQYRIEESQAEVDAKRRAALATLTELTGESFPVERQLDLAAITTTMPDVPALLSDPSALSVSANAARGRPEYAQYDATRERLEQEANALSVDLRPRLSAFVQGGVGRPGLNQLVRDTDPFYIAGVRASWRPFERQQVQRREEQIHLQQRMTDLQERAFTSSLARATAADREDVQRLLAARERDQQLVSVRADVERVARTQFDEGTTTAAAWVVARSDLLGAELQRSRHAVELEYARARLLTTLGVALQ